MNENTIRKLLKHTDLIAAVAVVVVVTMLIVPLPSMLLDLFITINISAALAVVVATMYLQKPLEFSAFPSLLLLTTMFRLAINVSVTRLILTKGDAGSVVRDFGQFVVGGNVVIGLVIFLILVVIQFVVVTNGAGRVAEVAARFTLDAMPGKQMAIDADLNAGLITDKEARHRRAEIAREADFYGAMDGASKFVKGDAMAAVIITGDQPDRRHRRRRASSTTSASAQATHTYSMLTVGDGLAAQIPALLISVATGIIVTRSASEKDLGSDLANQILAPAEGAAGGRLRGLRVRAGPGPAEAAVPVHRRDHGRDRLVGPQRHARRARRRGRRGRAPGSRPRPTSPPPRARRCSRSSRSIRSSSASASAWCRSSTAAPAARWSGACR